MAREIDWESILNVKGKPTFEEKWKASLADIGIFPTEKIYGKDIQTPTIGMEPGDPSWPTRVGATASEMREQRRKQEEERPRREEEERIKREKAKYGGVTYEEYKRRIQAGWRFLGPKEGFRGGKWMSPRLAAVGGGPGPRTLSPGEEEYPQLANYDKEVSKFMRSKDYQSMSAGDKLNFYKTTQNDRNKIKNDIDKKLEAERLAGIKAQQELPQEYVTNIIRLANEGAISKGAVAEILKNYPNDVRDDILAGIREPETPLEKEERLTSEEARERKRKEDELLTTFGEEYKFLGLTDKKGALYQKAVEAKDQLDLDKDKQVFKEKMEKWEQDYKNEQASTEQQNWATERQDKLDVFEEEKKQDIRDFGAEEGQRIFDNKMTTLDYLEDVRAAEAQEKLTGDKDLMNYTIAGIKEEHSWVQAIHTMGTKDKELAQSAYEFIQTFDFNKTKEETRAREFGQTYRLDVAQETAIQDRFEKSLTKEYTDLNLQIEKLGLAREIETRLAQTATFTAMMEIKKYGLAEAKQRLDGAKAAKEWIFKERYWQLDSAEAETATFKIMSDIYNDAKRVGTQQALANANIVNMENKLKLEYKKLEQKEIPVIELSSELSTTLSNMPEHQEYAIKTVGAAYNDKTGKFYEPSRTEINEVSDFLFGAEDEGREQIRFGVNLNTEDYVEQCLNTFGWSDGLKGWCIKNRDDPTLWNTIIATGTANDSYISPEIEETIKKTGLFGRIGKTLGGIGETLTRWFTFTEPVAPGIEPTTRVTRTGDIATDAENILTQYGEEISRSDMRKYLSDMGYSEAGINSVLGG